jgi:hypothetical protein
MGDGHRRAFAEQQHRHRLADDVGAADHHRVLAARLAKLRLQQVQAAERRARHQRVEAGRQPPGVERVEAVDVLGRVDRGDHPRGVDLRRQRQLDEDAVDALVGVELRDQVEQLGLAVVSGSL